MIYGNTGAGLVDMNVPQNPLYKDSLPDLKKVSANAWGLPSIDDIVVPTITQEKDIQTDTDVTDEYYSLAQKLKDYAIKGRAVGIDVTKPRNTPEQLQYAQQWNEMYNDFMQKGKDLKRGRENQLQMNKYASNPNSITADLPSNQVVTDQLLAQYSAPKPLPNSSKIGKAYQSLRIYDQPSYDKFMAKWKADTDGIDAEAEKAIANQPELADQIQERADAIKREMFPPNIDPRFYAKLEQDMAMHKDRMAYNYSTLDFRKQQDFNKQQQDEINASGFTNAVEQLLTTPNTLFKGSFGTYKANSMGIPTFEQHEVINVKGKDLTSVGATKNLKTPLGKTVPADDNADYIVVKYKDGDKTKTKVYETNNSGVASFMSDYNPAYKRQEKDNAGAIGTYGYDENGNEITPNQYEIQVGKKITNTTTNKKSSTVATKSKKTYKGLDANGNPIFE